MKELESILKEEDAAPGATSISADSMATVPSRAPQKKGADRGEIKPLTGVRALACFWVLAFHLREYFPKVGEFFDQNVIFSPIRDGFLGVDLFFLLSGFILSYNYSRPGAMEGRSGYFRFLGLRLARIYPVHLFMLFCMIPFAFGIHHILGEWPDWSGIPAFFANVLLINAWTLPLIPSWNQPAWSVSAEWFAYLLFPVYLFVTSRLTKPWKALAFIIACFAGLIAGCHALEYSKTSSYGILRLAIEFPVGCAMYQLFRMKSGAFALASRWADLFVLGGIAGIYFVSIQFFATMPSQALAIPFLALILYAVAWSRGCFAWFLSTPLLQFGGRASYAVYMVQYPCLLVLNRFLHTQPQFSLGRELLYAAIFLAAIILSGIAVHLMVEDPARLLCRRTTKAWAEKRKLAN